MNTKYEHVPDEEQIESLLESVPPEMSGEVETRLASAPWTRRAMYRQRTAWIVTAVCAAILVTFFASPPGRAWAQGVIGAFIRANSDTQPQEPLTNFPPDPTFVPDIAIVEAEARFDVLVPDWVPAVVTFKGATYDAERQIVGIFYYYSSLANGAGLETNGLIIRQQPLGGKSTCEICDMVGASAYIEEVQIHGMNGQYVQGVWKAIGDTHQWGWDPEPYVQHLRWQANGFAFEIGYFGIPGEVTKADLVHVAESMK